MRVLRYEHWESTCYQSLGLWVSVFETERAHERSSSTECRFEYKHRSECHRLLSSCGLILRYQLRPTAQAVGFRPATAVILGIDPNSEKKSHSLGDGRMSICFEIMNNLKPIDNLGSRLNRINNCLGWFICHWSFIKHRLDNRFRVNPVHCIRKRFE